MFGILEDVRGSSMYGDGSSQRYGVWFLARVNGEGIKPVFGFEGISPYGPPESFRGAFATVSFHVP